MNDKERIFNYLTYLEAQFWEDRKGAITSDHRAQSSGAFLNAPAAISGSQNPPTNQNLVKIKEHTYNEFKKHNPDKEVPKDLLDARIEQATHNYNLFNEMNRSNLKSAY